MLCTLIKYRTVCFAGFPLFLFFSNFIMPSTSSVSDLYLFDPDPDPAFEAEYRSGSNPDLDSIWIQGFDLMTKN
jgi:hypothetical protein